MFIPLAVSLGPGLINLAMQIYKTAAADTQTPEQKRAEYARIADALEDANDLVQASPLPPPGSGR